MATQLGRHDESLRSPTMPYLTSYKSVLSSVTTTQKAGWIGCVEPRGQSQTETSARLAVSILYTRPRGLTFGSATEEAGDMLN
jgi:hypothetical protein